MSRTLVVCGHGPGISDAVARRFGKEDFAVALVARSADRLSESAATLSQVGIRAVAFPCDLADPKQVVSMLSKVRTTLGKITVLHWNASAHGAGDLTTASADDLRGVLDVTVHGLVAAVNEALPDLEENHGAVLVTGGALSRYEPQFDSIAVNWNAMGLALGKAAQHKLVGLLHHKLEPRGIFVGEATVVGLDKRTRYDTGRAIIEPAFVAEEFWKLYERRAPTFVDVFG
jgi:NADP-dependent 3-hydroxy acid dehydrogenase YdfG